MYIKEAFNLICDKLKSGNIVDYEFEAKQLLRFRAGFEISDILLNEKDFNDDDLQLILNDCNKRLTGYPLQYILGEWEFYSLPFKVGEGVLIPRADTECLCEYLLEKVKGKEGLKILDLCSGTGCIGICLDSYTQHKNRVFLLEKYPKAQQYIKENIALNNSAAILISDDALNPKCEETDFDIIVSNPPYLTKEDMRSLQKEVSFEPKEALYGLDEDGLEFYRRLTSVWKNKLKKGGILAFEVGINQHNAVSDILKKNHFKNICFNKDLCGIIRNVIAER